MSENQTQTGKFPPLEKEEEGSAVRPYLEDYDRECARFSWDRARKDLTGLPEGRGLNIAYEAVDRHGEGPLRSRTAFIWVGDEADSVRTVTFGQLRDLTHRFANLLSALGVKRGEVVCATSKRIPEFYVAALGTLKFGGVFCPIFSGYGPEPLFQRLSRSRAAVLLTTAREYREKVAELRHRLPDLKHILLFDGKEWGGGRSPRGEHSLAALISDADIDFVIPSTDPEEPALLHFTSGTTGMPKGALHVHDAVVVYSVTGKYVLDLHPEDVFWCTADPGWVTGASYGFIAPLVRGVTTLVYGGEFDPVRWMQILEAHRVTVWYTTPSAIRRLMRLGCDIRNAYDLSRLRHILSVGEPLAPDAVRWGKQALGVPVCDTWWQTETGGIMIANYRAVTLLPGSMGLPLPGIEAAVAAVSPRGVKRLGPNEPGLLVIRSGWPSMFRGYLNEPARYRKCFKEGWYITGDLARQDSEGYFWFLGRNDDIIKTAGHMVGPFEVESVLMGHSSVADAAVVGIPDPVLGERVKAFIIPVEGLEPDQNLAGQVMAFARRRLGPAVAPREIEFRRYLPKNRAGKVVRRLLKAEDSEDIGVPPL